MERRVLSATSWADLFQEDIASLDEAMSAGLTQRFAATEAAAAAAKAQLDQLAAANAAASAAKAKARKDAEAAAAKLALEKKAEHDQRLAAAALEQKRKEAAERLAKEEQAAELEYQQAVAASKASLQAAEEHRDQQCRPGTGGRYCRRHHGTG